MAEFKPNVPVVQDEPIVSVDIKRENALPVGKHRFQLIVVDDAGNESEPAFIDVIVRDTDKPTAVLEMVDKNGSPVDPAVVAAGQSFILSGKGSKDTEPGKIKQWQFMLVTGNR